MKFGKERDALDGAVNTSQVFLRTVYSNADENESKAAVVDYNGSHTYRDMIDAVDRLTHLMISEGVSKGDRVAIILGRNMEHVAARLACMSIGAPFISINPTHPEERVREILSSCRPVMTIDDTVIARLGDYSPERNIDTGVKDCDEGYIVYTSGSTGKPKGVLHDRSLFLYADHEVDLAISEDIRIALITDMMFIANIAEMCLLLYEGGTLILIPEEMRRDIRSLLGFVTLHSANVMTLPPTLAPYLKDTPIVDIAVQGQTARLLLMPGKNIANIYGCSEMCMISSGYFAGKNNPSIGDPFPGSRMYLADESGKACDKGEIVITGPGLMIGYLNDPELTSSRTHVDQDGTRWFHTGDLGVMTPDGIVVLGRMDSMVKVNGQRVEPAEVEFAALKVPGVLECAVLPYGSDGNGRLCMHYMGAAEPEQLREALSQALPKYMVPTRIIRSEMLPHNTNGKIDRTRLALPKAEAAEYVAPANEAESILCDAFQEAFGIERIGTEDDFIALGGDSLTGMRIASICASKGLEVTASQLLTERTPGRIASVSRRVDEGSAYTLDSGCPLTGGALDIYLDIVSGKTDSVYVLGGIRPIPPGMGIDEVKAAVRSLIAAHPILGARIVTKDGEPWFAFDSEPRIYLDGEGFPSPETPFDMSQGLSRFLVSEADRSISFHIHHTISDGTSMMVLGRDMDTLLSGGELPTDLWFLRDAQAAAEDDPAPHLEFFGDMLSGLSEQADLVPESGGADGSGRIKLSVDPKALAGFARSAGTTPANLLTAAFGYTLTRFSGLTQALFTEMVNGRGSLGTADSVGMFVRTLPMVVDCSGRTVKELVRSVNGNIAGILDHQRCPYWMLAKEFDLTYSVLFNYLSGIDSSDLSAVQIDNKGDLSFEVAETGDGYVLDYFHTSRFTEKTVRRMAGAFDRIVSGLIGCDTLSDIVYTSEDDIALEESVNGTSREFGYSDILDALRDRVAEQPDRTLVTYGGRSVTYAEADRMSDSIAAELSSRGIKAGDRVAVMVPRSELYAVCTLGVLKAGAAYVPIDITYPDERVSFMLSDSSVNAVIVTPETRDRVSGLGFEMAIDCTSLPERPFTPLRVSSSSAAVVLYTSGTTGTPRGVVLSRGNLSNFTQWFVSEFGIDRDSGVIMFCSYGFDVHIESMLGPMVAGARTIILSDEERMDLGSIASLVRSEPGCILHLPAALGRLFMQRYPDLPLGRLIVGGESFGEVPVRTSYPITDKYGPTEATVSVTCMHLSDRRYDNSVGVPLANTKVYILDAQHRRVPYGAVGELFVSGRQIASGYVNNPDQNARSFIANPFSSEPGYGRMYATGDFFRFLPDGTLGFVSRRDGQVKVRGNRVELTEVEACIRSMPEVEDVTVQAVQSVSGSKDLCAYVVASGDVSEEDIRSYVSRRKPEYMVPAHVVRMDAIPLNPNGKVDRRALPKVDAMSESEYIAPRNDRERILCDAISEALGIERVGIEDDFIRLGGDSLKAIKVASICSSSGLKIKVSDILSLRKASGIASSASLQDVDLGVYSLETGCPLTAGALDVYLDIESGKNDAVYVIDTEFPIDGLNDDEAKRLIQSLLDAHPVLRTRIVLKDGAPWYSADAEPPVTVTSEPIADIRRPFVLSESLCRFNIVSGRNIQAAFHHIVSDGLTTAILARDAAAIKGGASLEPDLGFLRDAAYMVQSDKESPMTFFRDMFAEVGDDTGLIGDPDGKAGTDTVELSLTADAISGFARSMGVTPANLLAAAFGYTLSRFTGSGHAVFSNLVNGRDLTGSDGAAGMFVRTLPIALDCSDRGVPEFLKAANDAILGAISNQHCPFYKLSKELGIDYGIVFNHMTGMDQHGDRIDVTRFTEKDIVGDLSFDLIRDGGRYVLTYVHSSKFSESTVRRMAESFDRIVSGLIGCELLSQIRYTSGEDIALEEKSNGTVAPLANAAVTEAFRDAVAGYPGRNAVSYLDKAYTYAEADLISGRIASALKAAGVRKGDRVAILIPRSEWCYLAIIGAMKIGAVYLPIDLAYPDERVSYMLSDSSVKAVLITPETKDRALSLGLENTTDCTSLPEDVCDPIAISSSDPAVILYTSGTTGRPKGSILAHGAIINYLESFARLMSITEDDVVLFYHSYGFDVHIETLLVPILKGCKVDIVPEDIRLDMDALAKFIASRGVTFVHLPTSIGKLFMSDCPDLNIRCLVVGGEKLGEVDMETSYEVIDTYGPTECTVSVTYCPILQRSVPYSIGRSFDNTKVYILDREHRRVPYGAVGELYVSGIQLSTGYIDNPEANAKAFFPNPFSSESGYERIYATGDYVRMLPDGTIGYISRRDGQVKVRGNRVEVTEVEACIRSMPGIADVVVRAVPTGSGAKDLCAYVVLSSAVSEQDVQAYVSGRKPEYMVPAFVIRMEAIPLNVNGKVDMRALPLPDASSKSTEYVAPRNEVEKVLCEAFESALDLDRVGIDDDFIRLGGDSLKAIKAVSLCRSHGLEFKARDIISLRTVRAISVNAAEAVDMGSSVGEVGLTPLQRSFLSSGTPEQRNRYVQNMDLECRSDLDIETLQRAIDTVTDRHDMLRAVYGERNLVREAGIRVCTVRSVSAASEDDIIRFTGEAMSDLSLSEGRLVECLLIAFGGKKFVRLVINHMAVDGVSWGAIVSDLSECVAAIKDGREPRLPPRTLPFRVWIAKDHAPLKDEAAYWNDVPDEAYDFGEPKGFQRMIDIGDMSNPYGFEEMDILLAAFSRALKGLTGRDPVLRMEGHGRDQDVGRTVGWFTCVYPMRVEVAGECIADLFSARRARRDVPSGGSGFQRLYPERPLPAVTFNYLSSAFGYSDQLFRSTMLPMEQPESPFTDGKVSFNIHSVDGKLIVTGYCDPDLGLPEAVESEIRKLLGSLREGPYMCPLTGPQLNVYLDEVTNDKGIAYSAGGAAVIPAGVTEEGVRTAIRKVLDAHPVLRSRIEVKGGVPFLVADSEPEITVGSMDGFIRPFDLSGCLTRFLISPGYLVWDCHHCIMDAVSRRILIEDFGKAFSGGSLPVDLGFITAAVDSPDRDTLSESYRFFDSVLDSEYSAPIPDGDGTQGSMEIEMSVTRSDLQGITGITPGGLFTSAFGYTLSRFTGFQHPVFNMTDIGRDLAGAGGVVGMFVRTIPVSLDCSDRPVREFLQSSSDTILGCLSHDKVPFMEMSRRYGIDNSVAFDYLADINEEIMDIKSSMDVEIVKPVSDLTIFVADDGDGFKASLEHSGKYSEETCRRFLHAFDRIVSGLIGCEHLSQIRYTSDEDIDLEDRSNGTVMPLAHPTVTEAFREAVAGSPGRTAVSYLDQSYTYADADLISGRIASALKAAGVRKGDRVAIMVPRSEWCYLAIIGAMKAGAVYVPIDTAYPDERVSYMLSDSSVKAVLVTPETKERASGLVDNVIDFTALPEEVCEPITLSSSDPAVILYTSGTTGRPKGSILTQGAIINYLESFARLMSITEEDVVLFYHSYGFDVHIETLLVPILKGCKADIVPEDIRLDMDALAKFITSRGVTFVHLPTSIGKLFITDCPDLGIRCLVVGGEKLGEVDVKTSYDIIDTYGPTECTVSVTYCPLSQRSVPYSVGRPFDNTKVYVLDREHRRVPYGAVGELYVSGIQLSTGYIDNPEANSKAFFPNPFSSEHGYERIYATGDYVRMLPDGAIGYISRRDGQVKVRGNRVEVTEVEACIRSMPSIEDVTVQVVTGISGSKDLCAYVVPTDKISAEDVRSYVSQRKPEYMVPAFVILMEAIPLNVNGKVDKRALPEPDLSSLAAPYVAPRNEGETILCRVFSEVVGVEKVGIDDDFIRLGGDSLRATKAASVFNGMSSLHISVRDILRKRTVRNILSDSRNVGETVLKYDYETGHPPTFAQLDVIEYMEQSGLSLNIATHTTLPDYFDAEIVMEVLQGFLMTTPDMHMHLVREDGNVIVKYDAEIEVQVVECDPKEFAKTFVRRFHAFDPCLCRFAIVQWEGICHVFIDVCHLIFDGRSVMPMVGRLFGILTGTVPPVDEGLLRQAEYDRSYMQTPLFKQRVGEFVQLLEGSDGEYVDDPPCETDTGVEQRVLPIDGQTMEKVIKVFDAGPSDVFFSAYAYALSRVYGKDKMFYFIEDGRGDVDVSESVGLFMRLHPICVKKRADTIIDFAKDAFVQVDNTMKYSDIPLISVWNLRYIWPDMVIQYENYMAGGNAQLEEGMEVEPLKGLARSPFRMHSVIVPVKGGFAVNSTYSERMSGDRVRRILDEMCAYLDELGRSVQ